MTDALAADVEAFLKDNPAWCPDCGEYLLPHNKDWPRVIACPECGWPDVPEYVVELLP